MKTFLGLVACVVISNPLAAGILKPSFSVDPASPSITGGLGPEDILEPGPSVQTQGAALGLQDNFLGGVFDDLDALSYGQDLIQSPLVFSVDRVSVGRPGSAVNALAPSGNAAQSVFVALPPVESNLLFIDGGSLGLQPDFFGDDLNGLELDTENPLHTYFSIDQLSASNLFGALDLANDIFLDTFPNQFASGESHIGLDMLDDLDALVLDDFFEPGVLNPGVDRALFSLSPFSPSTFTFTGNAYDPGEKGALSPADILFTDFTGSFRLWASAAAIGLRDDDNVDALDTVPEPASSVMWVTAFTGFAFYLGFRRRSTARRCPGHSS